MNHPFAKPGEINYALFDRFTFAHAAWGAVMERLGAKATTAVGFAIGWELLEDALKKTVPHAFPYKPNLFPFEAKDSFDNRVGDIIGVMAGWALSRALAKPRP